MSAKTRKKKLKFRLGPATQFSVLLTFLPLAGNLVNTSEIKVSVGSEWPSADGCLVVVEGHEKEATL
jgi:hypothetical protein